MIPQVPPADLVQQQRHFFTLSRELGCSSWDSSEHCRIYCSKNSTLLLMAMGDKCNSVTMCPAVTPKKACKCLYEASAGRWMASTVTLKFGELIETIPLFEGRLHIPTIKDAFTLRVPRIDGVLAPVDSQGFTHAIFKPGDTLNISGTSSEVAAMPGTLHSRELLQWHKHKVHMLHQSISTNLCYTTQ